MAPFLDDHLDPKNADRGSEEIPYGRRLLPQWIDKLGRETPDKVWSSMPRSSNLSEGFKDYTYRHLVQAIDAAAWWIEKTVGRSSEFEPIAFLGHQDLRSSIFSMAMIKTGHQTLHLSTIRAVLAGHIAILERTRCKKLFYSEGLDVSALLQSQQLVESFKVPELDDLIFKQKVLPYPYNKTFEEAQNEPVAIAFTSGSTGMPKPIVWTHGFYATVDSHISIKEKHNGRENVYSRIEQCQRQYSSMPVNHGSGLGRFLRAVFLGVTLVVGPPGHLISSDARSVETLCQILKYSKADAAHLMPHTLHAMTKSQEGLQLLSKLKLILFAGAPLSKVAGQLLVEKCPGTALENSYGSSDLGGYVTYTVDRGDWEYQCFSPTWNGIEWRDAGAGLYELVMRRDPKLAAFQGAFKTHPSLDEVSTKDLFSKHPTKADHWRFECRADDKILGYNGTVFNPVYVQAQVEKVPAVRFAIMTGTMRERPTLIVQLSDPECSDKEKSKVFEEIWEVVSPLNEQHLPLGNVPKSHIIFTSAEKPFPTAQKGTVQRAFAIKKYEGELNELYANSTYK